jgi:hypothetical protein
MKFLAWFAISLLVLLLVAGVALFFIDEPLRAFIERQLNTHVEAYAFTVGKAHLYPNLSLLVEDLVMTQRKHPNPPVASIPKWHFSIQWRHIFSGVLVSDYLIDHPTLHITLPQAKKEVQDEVPIHQKGWRDAVYSFYPFKINEFKVVEADMTYVDQDPSKPLHLTHLNFRVGNIRNIRFPNDAYPSDLSLDGNIFGPGRIELKGHANFLSEPSAGINADLALRQVALEPLMPVTGRYNVQLRGGVLSADGHLEYTAEGQTDANLKTLTVDNVRLDYIHTVETATKETEVKKETVKTAKKLSNKPDTSVKIEKAVIKNSEFGFVNKAAKPPYRVFWTKGEMHLNNVSNQFTEGTGVMKIKGLFMGTGDTLISATFRPETKSPDFDMNIKIENTELRTLNDLLRAYGNFDVTDGLFSLYSELSVKNGAIQGYIKPLFRDMKVYDARQDKEKSAFQKLYEGLVGGVAKLLENRPRAEVATQVEISGPIENPKTSTWETVVKLIQNAFIKAILPGFERQVRGLKPDGHPGSKSETSAPAASSLALQ